MTTSRSPCVPDASVLIDFHVGGLLKHLLSLPQRWLLPDLTMAEMRTPDRSTLLSLGMEVIEFTGEEVSALIHLRSVYPALSLPDCANLFLAHRERALLLTGDRVLARIASHDFGLTVHGTLWALDRLLETHQLMVDEAASALRAMLEAGSRLPHAESIRRLERWEKG